MASRQPASDITDRAKRYRANADIGDEWPRVCLFCGSTQDLQVDHIDGFEENGEPENLIRLCRSCNQLKSNVYLRAGMGRRTVQYNPGIFSQLFGPKETYRTTGGAHPSVRKELAREAKAERDRIRRETLELRKQELADRRALRESKPEVVGRYKGFTIYKRGKADDPDDSRRFYSSFDPDSWFETARGARGLVDTFKNPAANYNAWRVATQVLRGKLKGSPFQAARVIRSTPVSRRYQYLDRLMRSNPAVPTFGQYAYAVSQHTRGAHDEGGAVIHATPKRLRKEYAERIADLKRGRGTARGGDEVPF